MNIIASLLNIINITIVIKNLISRELICYIRINYSRHNGESIGRLSRACMRLVCVNTRMRTNQSTDAPHLTRATFGQTSLSTTLCILKQSRLNKVEQNKRVH